MGKTITHGWTTSEPDDPSKDVSQRNLNDHAETYSGLTAGHVLRASAAAAADFAAIQDGDLPATIARDSEVTAAIAALSTTYQPLDSDLTAIAALATTAFGRGLLALANQAALLAAAGAAAASHAHAGEDITSGTVADGRVAATLARDAEVTSAVSAHEGAADPHPGYLTGAEGNAAYQPLDSDLTAIAALTTTSFGRAFLALADAAALRTAAGLVPGTDIPSLTAFNDHSARHENGGGDEISVAGLSGELADAQPPKAHAASHSDGGSDAVDVTDLDGYPGGTTDFLRADGTFATPPGGGGSDDQTAAEVPFSPAGGIAATDVQAALQELDTEKATLASAVMDGDAAGGDLGGTYPNPSVSDDSHAHTSATLPGLAPTGADYLVGTAQGGLSAEIVVGATPGGELGGTWGSPTVDATHSGSSHAGLSGQPGATDVAVADGGTGSSTASGARTNLGVVIGTDVEAHDSDLTTIAGLAPTDDDVLQRKAGAWANRTIAQLLADLAAAGTTFQPLDSDLTALAGLAIAADKLPYGNGSHTMALADLTAFARTLLDDADAATARATLGAGTGNGNVTNPMTTAADLIVGGASGAPARLAKGSDGQVLTVDPTTHLIVWATPSGGGSSDGILGQSGVGGARITGFQGHPDIAPASPDGADDEFDTTDTSDPMSGWTTLGAPTHDINSTHKGHYFVSKNAASVALQGIFKTRTVPFTITCKLSSHMHVSSTSYRAGLFVAEASPGKISSCGVVNDSLPILTLWTNPTTFSSNPGMSGFTGAVAMGIGPMYLRIVATSSTNVSYYVSGDGLQWTPMLTGHNPAFTVGAAGVFINPIGALTTAVFDWVRWS